MVSSHRPTEDTTGRSDLTGRACSNEYFLSFSTTDHARAYERGEPVVTDRTEYKRIRERNPLLLDVETNLAQDRIWCIGVYDYSTDTFDQFVDLDDEDALISDLAAYLDTKEAPEIISYSGTHFDKNQILDAAERHGTQIADQVGDWTDLCLVVRETTFIPQRSRSLDNLARAVGYTFEHPDVTGLEIGSAYSTYLSEGEVPENGWREYLEYNLDDTIAMKHILDMIAGSQAAAGSTSTSGFEDYSISEQWRNMPAGSTSSSNDSSQGESEEDQGITIAYDVSEVLHSVPAKSESELASSVDSKSRSGVI